MCASKLHRQTDTAFQNWTVQPETGQVATLLNSNTITRSTFAPEGKRTKGGSFFFFLTLYRSQLMPTEHWKILINLSGNVSHLKTIYRQVIKFLATD